MNSGSNNGGPLDTGGEEFDRLFGGANPNPDRVGCPPEDVLRALATKQRPIGDPAYEHLAECSPCYRKFRNFQTTGARTTKRITHVATAAAVLVALVAAGGYLIKQNEGHAPRTHVAATLPDLPNIKQLTADLRNAAPTRSSRPASTAGSVKLSRDLVQLTIVLPVGSEPGRYSVRLLRGAGEVVAAAAVDASIVNFATTLTATLDLRGVQPAPYALELQRAGEHADSYPVVVK
jgi:hypothetical protein